MTEFSPRVYKENRSTVAVRLHVLQEVHQSRECKSTGRLPFGKKFTKRLSLKDKSYNIHFTNVIYWYNCRSM